MSQILLDNGGKRSGIERRQFSYHPHIPERRSGKERRSGNDRRREPRPLKNLIYFKGAGLEMALPFYCPTFDTCYVYATGKAILKVVISYSKI
jgi:hypothetical protein